MLRTGGSKTRGHPFQGCAGIPIDFMGLTHVRRSGWILCVFCSGRVSSCIKPFAQKRSLEMHGARSLRRKRRNIRERAAAAGLTKSEWCRKVILDAMELPPWGRIVLSEILALRKILLGLNLELIHGSAITERRLRAIVEDAEVTKSAWRKRRLQKINTHQTGRVE